MDLINEFIIYMVFGALVAVWLPIVMYYFIENDKLASRLIIIGAGLYCFGLLIYLLKLTSIYFLGI